MPGVFENNANPVKVPTLRGSVGKKSTHILDQLQKLGPRRAGRGLQCRIAKVGFHILDLPGDINARPPLKCTGRRHLVITSMLAKGKPARHKDEWPPEFLCRQDRSDPGMRHDNPRRAKRNLEILGRQMRPHIKMRTWGAILTHLRNDLFSKRRGHPIHLRDEPRKRKLRADRHEDHRTLP